MKTSKQIFLDDERITMSDNWLICRTKKQFDEEISQIDSDTLLTISFDHDLGEKEPSGYEILKSMLDLPLMHEIKDMEVIFHSQNPVGRENMVNYFKSWCKFHNKYFTWHDLPYKKFVYDS